MTDIREETIQFIDALLNSADIDLIGKNNWYQRATTALETAAAGAQNLSEAATIAARKMQIDVLNADSAETITALTTIDDNFAQWQELVPKEIHYLIALVRIRRKTKRKPASKKTQQEPAQFDVWAGQN